jgi:flagellar hook protein FlgE
MSLIGTLTSGVSALRSFTQSLETIGNNIANVNTTGFKSSRASFADSFSNTLRGSTPSAGAASNLSAEQVGTGVRLSQVQAQFTQGSLTTTGLATDLGISGNGFFKVVNPVDGNAYVTRAGNFRIDDQGYLVTSQGYHVQGFTGGAAGTPPTAPSAVGDIKLGTPPTGTQLQNFSFDRLGNMVEFYSDGSSVTTNQVLLQNFSDPTALVKNGDNLFTGFSAAGPVGGLTPTVSNNAPGASGLGFIEGGTLEQSNVDLTNEFSDMISTERSFQAASRLISVSDEVLQEIVNMKH